jgi:hypothetical protein
LATIGGSDFFIDFFSLFFSAMSFLMYRESLGTFKLSFFCLMISWMSQYTEHGQVCWFRVQMVGESEIVLSNATLSYLCKNAFILLNNFLCGTFFNLLLMKFIARATICCIIGWLHPCSFCHSELGQFLFLRTT